MCNLRCRYCFYADVSQCRSVPFYGFMTKESADALITHVAVSTEPGDSILFAFQGGEPTLAGLPFFQHFAEEAHKCLKGVHISYVLQTNGTLIDEEWCLFFAEMEYPCWNIAGHHAPIA